MKVTALALDPIEKKPLARFHPGSMVLSVGSLGCTMHCPWCQNHDIAQPDDPARVSRIELSPEKLVDKALELRDEGNIGIAYTYNEPLMRWQEVLECARAAHDAGLLNVVVTNGLLAPAKFEQLAAHVDAFNIDLKGFTQDVYDLTGGTLEMVKENISIANNSSHVEVTTLIIPGVNDDLSLIEQEAAWLAGVDENIPLHLTRFFPHHLYSDRPPTAVESLLRAREVAKAYLLDVFLGNV